MDNVPANIYKGGQATLVLRLFNPLPSTDYYDLTDVTQITACFANANGTELLLTFNPVAGVSILNAVGGKVQIALTAAQTVLLQTTVDATLQLSITFAGDPIIVQITSAYSVIESAC